MHTGRHRMKSHGGIPHGSTLNLAANLSFYYQWNNGESASIWPDSSSNGNDAEQETADNRPTLVTGGGLDFEDTNDAATASWMDFTSFNVAINTNFLSFIVCKIEDSVSNACYLSDSGAEVMQFTSAGAHQFKTTNGGAPTSNISHGGGGGPGIFNCDAGEKLLMMIHRTNGATGTIKVYKNGLVCDGHNDSGTVNRGNFDLQNLGTKAETSNWFDGIMYDVGVTATDQARDMITDYLCAKHGIKRLG